MQAAGALLSAGLGIGTGLFGMSMAKKAMPTGPGPAPTFSILAGQQQQQAYDAEAQSLGQESTYALQSSLLQAAQNDYQTNAFRANQDAQFGAAGVTLAGSPLGILTETTQLGNQVSNQIRLQGQLQSQLYQEEGLQMLRAGNAAAFQGQANASIDQYNYELQKAGIQAGAMSAAAQGFSSAAGLALGGLSTLKFGGGAAALPTAGIPTGNGGFFQLPAVSTIGTGGI